MTIPQRIPNASRTGHCAIPAAVAFEQGSPPSATADCRCWDAALSTLACGHRLRRLSALTKPHPSSPLGHRAFDGQKGCRALSRARLVPTCASEPAEKGLSISSVVRALFHWLGGSRVKVKSRSPASSRLSATALHLSRHLRKKARRRCSISPGEAA